MRIKKTNGFYYGIVRLKYVSHNLIEKGAYPLQIWIRIINLVLKEEMNCSGVLPNQHSYDFLLIHREGGLFT